MNPLLTCSLLINYAISTFPSQYLQFSYKETIFKLHKSASLDGLCQNLRQDTAAASE